MDRIQERRLVLIRHAQSQSNVGLPTLDPTNIDLTEAGRAQALKLAIDWKHPPDLIVVSPYLRARLTAQPLIERFHQVPVADWPVHEFTYLKRPPQPTTPTQRKGRVDQYWTAAEPHECQQGAESFAAFWCRVAAFHATAINCEAPDVVVVTHGGFMLAFDWICAAPGGVADASLMRRFGQGLRRTPFANVRAVEYRLDVSTQRWCRRVQTGDHEI